MPDIDLNDYSYEELRELYQRIALELQRRETLLTAQSEIERIIGDTLQAEGVTEGDPWRQPTGVHNSYPLGWVVTHNNKVWESLISANPYEPGVSGWREVAGEDEHPEWVQPTGAHDAYNTGDIVTYNGLLYKSKIDGNTWSPSDYPAGWEQI